MPFVPSYVSLFHSGELHKRAERLWQQLATCRICPHECGNNRLTGEIARCCSGALPIVSAYVVHFGEEPALVGTRGVGNIFFGNCNLRCVYCQNYLISQNAREENKNEVTVRRLAEIMLELQAKGCHALGLVSPTHVVPQILRSLELAVAQGFSLPLIYNTNAYDSVEILRELDGIVDIYLPDLKYADDDLGYTYSKIKEYSRFAKAAIQEMHRQVGSDLLLEDDGLIKRGLVIRHLVLPNDVAGSREAMQWIKTNLGERTTLSVMCQYFPTHRARTTPLLDRKLRESEYAKVLAQLEMLGFENGWAQEFEASEYYRPDFEDRQRPFKGRPDNTVDGHVEGVSSW